MNKEDFLEKYVLDDCRDFARIDLELLCFDYLVENFDLVKSFFIDNHKKDISKKIEDLRCDLNEKKMSRERMQKDSNNLS